MSTEWGISFCWSTYKTWPEHFLVDNKELHDQLDIHGEKLIDQCSWSDQLLVLKRAMASKSDYCILHYQWSSNLPLLHNFRTKDTAKEGYDYITKMFIWSYVPNCINNRHHQHSLRLECHYLAMMQGQGMNLERYINVILVVISNFLCHQCLPFSSHTHSFILLWKFKSVKTWLYQLNIKYVFLTGASAHSSKLTDSTPMALWKSGWFNIRI